MGNKISVIFMACFRQQQQQQQITNVKFGLVDNVYTNTMQENDRKNRNNMVYCKRITKYIHYTFWCLFKKIHL